MDEIWIPRISTIISAYVAGREIKEILESADDGLSVSDKATIISDIAAVLGFDKISSVTGLVSDIDDFRESNQLKTGTNEAKTGKNLIEDVADAVESIIN